MSSSLRRPSRAGATLLLATAVLAGALLAPAVPSSAAGSTGPSASPDAAASSSPSAASSPTASPSTSPSGTPTPSESPSESPSDTSSPTATSTPEPTETSSSTPAPVEDAVAPTGKGSVVHFRAASFNILGTQHTLHSTQYASGPTRARMAARWLRNEGVSVLGMSEAQRDQMKVLVGRGGWRSFPSWKHSTDTETAQSVLWRPERWTKVRAKTFTVPFNTNQTRKQPMVLLRHDRTGRKLWVVSTHFTYGSSPQARRERRIGTRRTIRNVHQLQDSDYPVLLTGDMNAHRRVFCKVVGKTALQAVQGGSHRGGRCRTPQTMRIDWLFGAARFDASRWRFADGPAVDKITDHSVPVAKFVW